MIRETLKASGKKTIEIKQRILFPHTARQIHYSVDTWFFFPTNLLINRWNYSPATFQQNLKNYIRLRPPTASLRKMALKDDAVNAIEQALQATINSIDPQVAKHYEHALKLFCLVYKRALRLAIKRIQRLDDAAERDAEVIMFAQTVAAILARYRALAIPAKEADARLASPAFAYCDEYLAIVTTQYGIQLLHTLPDSPAREQLRSVWREQMHYRDQHYPDSVPQTDSDNELPVYRWSILKKYVSSLLFLDVRRQSGETLLAQTIASIAAALAMIFATAVAFIWQGKYGALSTPLFLAMVIGYIFKDRMKESFRNKMFSWFRRWLPDRRQIIYKNFGEPIGLCEESFVFVSENRLPIDVRILRRKSLMVDVQNSFISENVLLYSKRVKVKDVDTLTAGINRSIMDITRLDITDFLRHTDELFEELPVLDDESMASGEKVYHINLIRQVNDGRKSTMHRVRMVINREGIKRVEEVDLSQPADGF